MLENDIALTSIYAISSFENNKTVTRNNNRMVRDTES